MDQKKYIKQAIDFHRNTFNNIFQSLVLLQDQTERVSNMVLEQVNLIPKDGKSVIEEWTEKYKKERDNYKETVNAGLSRVEELLGATN